MLKRLFVFIFILQVFATSAWGGMDMSQLNQAETAKMQIMHHMMTMNEMDTSAPSTDQTVNVQMHSMTNCNGCDDGATCQNLVCGAIHAITPFIAQSNIVQTATLIANGIVSPLLVSIQYSNSQPETPPPSA
jgi:hypothetical protein